jgi:peptidoglycan/xylan/chitin deacetylase (PgdA/CDA1 family)
LLCKRRLFSEFGLVDDTMKTTLKKIAKRMGVKRSQLAAARMFVERQALAAAGRREPRQGGRVLCYHSVGQPQSGTNDVSPAMFRRHIEIVLSHGFTFVPARRIAETGGAPTELAITFDDAWASVLDTAGPILKEYDIPWTVFVVSEWCNHSYEWARSNFLNWRRLEQVADFGGDIGSHSVTHPDFGKIPRDEMVEELERSRDAIVRELGFTPTTFAIPFGQSMNWPEEAHRAACAAGYEVIYAQADQTRPPGTVPRTFITQFDDERLFKAAIGGAYDRWEEWV